MPGHERFVRTMISGATGIGAVLLVVDAREGIQPQTVEHVGIAGLIGVRRGIVAVTKCDLVPVEEAVAAGEAAAGLARDAGIAEVTAVRTSAVTGEGWTNCAGCSETCRRVRQSQAIPASSGCRPTGSSPCPASGPW